MKIGIIGYGWLGSKLADFLLPNYKLFVTTTSADKIKNIESKSIDFKQISFSDIAIENNQNHAYSIIQSLDVIIITVPFSKRNTLDALNNRFKNLINFIGTYDKQCFLMSSTGIYPQENIDIYENTFSNDKLETHLFYIEQMMRNRYPKINVLRLGGLMGADRVFSDYNITKGLQTPVNHIHYDDICAVIYKMIQLKSSAKTYNVVSPIHPIKQDIINFQKHGYEPNNETVLTNVRIIHANLLQQELNYQFIRPNPLSFNRE